MKARSGCKSACGFITRLRIFASYLAAHLCFQPGCAFLLSTWLRIFAFHLAVSRCTRCTPCAALLRILQALT